MKDKILAFLLAKLAGIQKSYLEGIAETYSKTITEETQIESTLNEGVLTVLKFTAQQLQVEGDRRATEATQTAITNYEKKNNLKDGKPVVIGGTNPPTPTPPPSNDDAPAWAKSLIESNKAMSERLAAFEQEKTKQEKVVKAHDAIQASKLPENLKQKWSGRLNVESEISIEDQVKELENEYTEINTTIVGTMSGKGLPVGGQVNGTVSEQEVDAILNKI